MRTSRLARRQKGVLLGVFALAILIGVMPTNVLSTASYSVSIVYTEFNSGTATEHTFPGGANYTLPWKVVITNKLTYNETTSNPVAILLLCNASDKDDLMDLMFQDTGVVDVYQSYTGSGVKIGSFPWTTLIPATYTFSVDGLVVKNKTDTQFEFNFNAWPLRNVSAKGSAEDMVTAGTMQLDFSSGTGDFGLDIVFSVVPLMVTIAVLGMIIKMFDKMGKNI